MDHQWDRTLGARRRDVDDCRPGPSASPSARSAGAVASTTGDGGLWRRVLRAGLRVCAMTSAKPAGYRFDPQLEFGFLLPIAAGCAVAAVWDFSILVRGYRVASDWVDRLGWLIGLYWVVLMFLIMFQSLVSMLAIV